MFLLPMGLGFWPVGLTQRKLCRRNCRDWTAVAVDGMQSSRGTQALMARPCSSIMPHTPDALRRGHVQELLRLAFCLMGASGDRVRTRGGRPWIRAETTA